MEVDKTQMKASNRRTCFGKIAIVLASQVLGTGEALGQLGAPITAPGALNTNAATDAGTDKAPSVATDGAGNWVVVWESKENLGGTIGTDEDILVARSTDNGATWTVPAALNTNAATDAENDNRPRVAPDGLGNWMAVWDSKDDLGATIGTDEDILVARSTDNGATWTAPAALNTNAATDAGDDKEPVLATDGLGNWVVVWQSKDDLGGTIGTDEDILVARSTDNGATWTALQALNTNAATDAGTANDKRPSVAPDGTGNWVAVWDSKDNLSGTIGTDEDVLVARSTDNGATWTAQQALNTNASTDAGNDKEPALATDGAGNWVAVWESKDDLGGTIGTDDDILVARSTDNGATWTAPAALNTSAATDAENDNRPRVAPDGLGNWMAVWDSKDDLGGTIGTEEDILLARSTDDGATWAAQQVLNTNAATDTGTDKEPVLATDGGGNWVVVWESKDDLGATIGTEEDILVARFFLGPGITITESGGSTDVDETGPTSDTYTIVLDTRPAADVTITVDPDTQTDVGAGAGNPADLTFTSANWNVAQTVTVTAVDDSVDEVAHTSTITHSAASTDGNYNGIALPNVTAAVSDNDTAGVTLVESGAVTMAIEGGATDTYTIVLDTQPTADVTVTVDPDTQTDVGAGGGNPANLTFTSGNWSVAQTVTVTAVDDSVIEGVHSSTITHSTASGDGNYNGVGVSNVTAGIADAPTTTVVVGGGGVSAPVAHSQSVSVDGSAPAEITLSASGNVGSDPSYFVVSGPAQGTLTGDPPNLVYIADLGYTGTDSFTYIVANGNVTSNVGTVTLDVLLGNDSAEENQRPVADAGPDQTVEPGTEVILSAEESFDPEGDALTYAWVQVSRPLVADRYDQPYPEPSWSFIAPDVASTKAYEFELTVTDSGTPPRFATDSVVITVAVEPNKTPVAVGGADQSVWPGEVVVLSGEESYDADGELVAFLWAQSNGPSIMDEPVEADTVVFEAPTYDEPKTLTFELTVTDDGDPPLSSSATVNVTVLSNTPPVAVAGPDQSVVAGDIVVLSGEDSYDPDEDLPLVFAWTQIEGPKVWNGTIEGELVEFDCPEPEEPAILAFQLSVTDAGQPPRTGKAVVRIEAIPSSWAASGGVRRAALCGVGLPLVLGAMSFVMLAGTRAGRVVVRLAARMLACWVADARCGRTHDERTLGKRRHPRWSWSREIVVRLPERQESVLAEAADVSKGGIRIWFPEPLKVGQDLQLSDQVGDVWLQGRVVHVADEPDERGRYRMGIQLA